MPTISFGRYLLEQGVITEPMLVEALEYQRKSIRPVRETAAQSGRLSREALARLREESGGSAPSDEENALRERIRSLEQLESSWRNLSERGVFLIEALSQKGYVSREKLDALWKEYRRKTSAQHIDLERVLPNAPETRHILESLIEIALDIFAHYTSETPELLSITQSVGEFGDDTCAFVQGISGDIDVRYVLLAPKALVVRLASCMLQEELRAVDDVVLEAMQEFLNVLVGNTCAKLSMRDYHVTASPPRSAAPDSLAGLTAGRPIVVQARVAGHAFRIAYSAG